MRRANFIVGFNNWSKTTIIRSLFAQKNFKKKSTYSLPNSSIRKRFIVKSISNDDIGDKFISDLIERINFTKEVEPDLIAALCPSMENGNNYQQILDDQIFSLFTEKNFFLLKYKWDHHAELMCRNIINDLSTLTNSNFYIIDNDYHQPVNLRTGRKTEQLIEFLNSIYL